MTVMALIFYKEGPYDLTRLNKLPNVTQLVNAPRFHLDYAESKISSLKKMQGG